MKRAEKRKIHFAIFIITFCFSLFIIGHEKCFADWFVATKTCNIRSGPGINYKIIGNLLKWEYKKIPYDFMDYDNQWIPLKISTKYIIGDTVKEGWYNKDSGIENLIVGRTLNFSNEERGNWQNEKGELVEILQKTREFAGAVVYIGVKYKTFEQQATIGFVFKKHGHIVESYDWENNYNDNLDRRTKAIKSNPSWNNEIKKLVVEGKIRLGMISEQAKAAWGEPKNINESVGTWGVHEQWVYDSHYLYFENGVLTNWQD